jgi:hypothetical protein
LRGSDVYNPPFPPQIPLKKSIKGDLMKSMKNWLVFLLPILILIALVLWKGHFVLSTSEPLIYFASSDLEKKIVKYTSLASYLPNKKIVIIQSPKKKKDSYSSVNQLFNFIARNSKKPHGNGLPWQSLEDNNKILFHSSRPLVLSCGKISVFFSQFITKYLDVPPQNIRLVDMWSKSSIKIGASTKGYLRGGHELLEIYFKELGKWVAFDLFFGVIPHNDNNPLSLFERIRTMKVAEKYLVIEEVTEVGIYYSCIPKNTYQISQRTSLLPIIQR